MVIFRNFLIRMMQVIKSEKALVFIVCIGLSAISFSDPAYVQALPSDDFSQSDSQDKIDDATGSDAFGQQDVDSAPSAAPAASGKQDASTKKPVDLSPMDASAQSTLLLSRMMQVNQDFLAFESKTTDQINQLQVSNSQLSSQISQIQAANQQLDVQMTPIQTANDKFASQISQLQAANQQLTNQVSTLSAQLAIVQATVSGLAQQSANPQPHSLSSIKDFKNEIGAIPFYIIVGIFGLLIIIIFILTLPKKRKKVDAPKQDHKSDYDYLSTKEALPAKLDLARSYIVMEDFQSARCVLLEIIKDGDEAQKTAAAVLLKACEMNQSNG
jgi:FimV-like protein